MKGGFCRVSPLKVADFSFNYLVGSVPKCLEYLPRTSFQGNCIKYKDVTPRDPEQCGVALPAKPVKPGDMKPRPAENKRKRDPPASKPAWLLALEVVTGIMVGSIFVVALLTAAHRWKTKSPIITIPWKKSGTEKEHMQFFIDNTMLKDVISYSRKELEVACEDFSNIIGSSSDSVVYKGIMEGGPEVAVISLCNQENHWMSYLELYFQKDAKNYLEELEKMASVVDPLLKHFRDEDLRAILDVVTICIQIRRRENVTMQELCAMLESKLDTTGSSELKASSLAWAELALSS